jgi:alpha-glucosidase (family GH31 glycosyl hydrolase)
MDEAHTKGWPLMRPMAAHYGDDANSWCVEAQYMFGADFMVAPVLDKSENNQVSSVDIYIPSNSSWVHLWTGEVYSGGSQGKTLKVEAPIGQPPVFYTVGSTAGMHLQASLVSQGWAHPATNTVISEMPILNNDFFISKGHLIQSSIQLQAVSFNS